MSAALHSPWKILGRWFAIILCLYIIVILWGCSTTTHKRGELFDQRVVFVSGFDKGPVNKQCDEYDGKDCKKWNTIQYDLTDQKVRDEFFRLKFVCNVAGERFFIAKTFAGLDRLTIKNGIFSKKMIRVAYFRVPEDHYKLVNSQARCAALESINGKLMFLQ